MQYPFAKALNIPTIVEKLFWWEQSESIYSVLVDEQWWSPKQSFFFLTPVSSSPSLSVEMTLALMSFASIHEADRGPG